MSRPPVFPVEDKIRIVLSVLSGEMTIAEAARRNKVSEQSVSRWKAQFLESGLRPVGTVCLLDGLCLAGDRFQSAARGAPHARAAKRVVLIVPGPSIEPSARPDSRIGGLFGAGSDDRVPGDIRDLVIHDHSWSPVGRERATHLYRI